MDGNQAGAVPGFGGSHINENSNCSYGSGSSGSGNFDGAHCMSPGGGNCSRQGSVGSGYQVNIAGHGQFDLDRPEEIRRLADCLYPRLQFTPDGYNYLNTLLRDYPDENPKEFESTLREFLETGGFQSGSGPQANKIILYI